MHLINSTGVSAHSLSPQSRKTSMPTDNAQRPRIHLLGVTDYETTWHAMQAFTTRRTAETPDEIWVTEHPPVYTLGLNRQDVRMPWRDDIPLVLTDRGGKITYHGPGQAVVYLLVDIKRNGLDVRAVVDLMEGAILQLLAQAGVHAESRADAPGVYVDGRKVASLGLRIKHGCCYHGLSLNVDMDLSPFSAIDPCGYRGLQVTQLRDLGLSQNAQDYAEILATSLAESLTHP